MNKHQQRLLTTQSHRSPRLLVLVLLIFTSFAAPSTADATHPPLDFGTVTVGETRDASMEVCNQGQTGGFPDENKPASLHISWDWPKPSHVSAPDRGPFHIYPPQIIEEIPPMACVDVRLGFSPTAAWRTGRLLHVFFVKDGQVRNWHAVWVRGTGQDTPIAGLVASASPNPVTAGAPTTLSALVSAGTNVRYLWRFGDGTFPQWGATVSHTYWRPGAYTATVTASNSAGLAIATVMVTVQRRPRDNLTWTTKASLPTPQRGPGAAASNGHIYALGGSGDVVPSLGALVEKFDGTTDTWTNQASIPTPRMYLGVTAASNGKIYAIGSCIPEAAMVVEEYDPAADTWATRASMPTPRCFLGVAASNGKVYAIGGANPDGPPLATVEEYDPTTDTWTPRASMPTPRAGLAVVAASNGKIYAIGGMSHTGLATVEEYDPVTDTWTPKASMPTGRYGLGAAAASNGKIYAVGGMSDQSTALATVEAYDPATNTWATQRSMSTPRWLLGVAAIDERLYAIGGQSGVQPLTTVEEAIIGQ